MRLKYTLIIFVVICCAIINPQVSFGTCSYSSGSITCTLDSRLDDTTAQTGTASETSVAYVFMTDTTREYIARWKVNVPKGATITSGSHVSMYSYANYTNTSAGTIQLIDDNNCDALTSANIGGNLK